MENKNSEQDSRLARIEQKHDDWDKTWDRFLTNDFNHLRKRVNQVFVFVICGILVPILLYIIQNK